MANEIAIINESDLKSKIYIIRGVQVMLDMDLAEIYGYETKRFNEQVKNNIERFDDDFRFQLTDAEVKDLRSKISTTNISLMSRSLPYAFTEQGIYMLMTVLRGGFSLWSFNQRCGKQNLHNQQNRKHIACLPICRCIFVAE